MPNYINSKIYTIRFYNSNDIYIGSTTQSLSKRFGKHKEINGHSSVRKCIINKYNGDWSNCYIELYENYPCNSKEELDKKEGEIIRLFINDINYNSINCLIAGRNTKERYEDNKDKYNLQRKLYREENKELIQERRKEKINCICGSFFLKDNRARHEKSKKHQEYIKSLS